MNFDYKQYTKLPIYNALDYKYSAANDASVYLFSVVQSLHTVETKLSSRHGDRQDQFSFFSILFPSTFWLQHDQDCKILRIELTLEEG